MNPSKTEDDIFIHHHHHNHHNLGPQSQIIHQNHHHHHQHLGEAQSQPSIPSLHEDDPSFSSLPEIVIFRSSSASSSPSHSSSSDEEDASTRRRKTRTPNPNPNTNPNPNPNDNPLFVSPDPHISSQFYTFNADSHALMIRCLIDRRLASPPEIRAATPRSVLKSWRAVWKDRNEDTAYLTAWKRIQDKLSAHIDPISGDHFLCFKNNSNQFVSHVSQWHDIVTTFHADADLKHLGLKDTVDRIKKVWTVGAKFYGIPESFIRVCVASCPVCTSAAGGGSGGSNLRSKRRRFEYTESFDVPAKDVPDRLQQLAAKHKVVLCIRQKYIRYKPFMAEVKDYACHRAGEPAAAKKSSSSKVLKREPYASKRCGCGFRIRAIVPIANYNEKDKTFVYQEEGVAVFKLYAVHSGHEPGPLDGNARIMHRVVGHKGGYMMDQDTVYGVSEDLENEGFGDGDLHISVLQQVNELRAEVGLLEAKIAKIPPEYLGSVSRDLFDIVNRVRRIGEDGLKPMEMLQEKPNSDDVLVGDDDLAHWSDHHHDRIYVDGKDTELIEDDEDSFERTLGDVVSWDQMRTDCRGQKDLMGDSCKPEKWLKCGSFDEKSLLECEDTKLTKPLRHDESSLVADVGLVGIQVDSFYQDNPKWYDSPCGLDSTADCGDSGFRHGEIV